MNPLHGAVSKALSRAPRLFANLELAHGDGRFARLFRMLVKVDLLILDDWGPNRLTASQRRDLMEICRGSPRALSR
jgi:DNA replication protein DnaC